MRDPANILVAEDIGKARTPVELCDWVDSKVSEFTATKESKEYARSGDRLVKKLWEEIRPFALFARHRYSRHSVRCTPSLFNDNYDGTIDFFESSAKLYVEITYAKDGKDEHLRLEALSQNGSVNALGRIMVVKAPKSGRVVCVEDESVNHAEVRNAALHCVKECLRRKSNKNYGMNHILVVVVDDYIPFRMNEDKAILMTEVQDQLLKFRMNVRAVYLLGASGSYCERAVGDI